MKAAAELIALLREALKFCLLFGDAS